MDLIVELGKWHADIIKLFYFMSLFMFIFTTFWAYSANKFSFVLFISYALDVDMNVT